MPALVANTACAGTTIESHTRSRRAVSAHDRQSGSHLTLWHEERKLSIAVLIHTGCEIGRGMAVRLLKDAALLQRIIYVGNDMSRDFHPYRSTGTTASDQVRSAKDYPFRFRDATRRGSKRCRHVQISNCLRELPPTDQGSRELLQDALRASWSPTARSN